jgi:hypothetical protein
MWVITLLGVVFYAMLVVQFVKIGRSDFTLALLGVLVAVVLTGPLGTYVGLHQAGLALGSLPPDEATVKLGQAIGIAHVPSAYAFLLAVPGAVALGVAASRARRRASTRAAHA